MIVSAGMNYTCSNGKDNAGMLIRSTFQGYFFHYGCLKYLLLTFYISFIIEDYNQNFFISCRLKEYIQAY